MITNAIYKANIEVTIHEIKGLINQLSTKEKLSIAKDCFDYSDWPAKYFDLVKMEISEEMQECALNSKSVTETAWQRGIGQGLHIVHNIINKYEMQFSLEKLRR